MHVYNIQCLICLWHAFLQLWGFMHFQRFNTHRINASLRVKLSSSWFRYSTSMRNTWPVVLSCTLIYCCSLFGNEASYFPWPADECCYNESICHNVSSTGERNEGSFRGNSRANSTISLYFCIETIPARALLCNAQVIACCCMLLAPAVKL